MKKLLLLLILLGTFACSASRCCADMALLVEDPAGYKGFFSDSGHLAVWISDGCVGRDGEVTICEGGSGVVLSSTSYWMKHGWAAIPAQTYLEGVSGERDTAAWSQTLHATYPDVPLNYGRKYIARLDHRGIYVMRIRTSRDQDAKVLESLQQGRSNFAYEVWFSNCSDYARQVLELYFPGSFGRRVVPDFGISTPHGVANRFWKLGRSNPELEMRVYYIPRRTPSGHLHDGRTKGICEAAITDVKYAGPLLFYQPLLYAAFGACYLTIDQPGFMHRGFARGAERITSFEKLNSTYEARVGASDAVEESEAVATDEALVVDDGAMEDFDGAAVSGLSDYFFFPGNGP